MLRVHSYGAHVAEDFPDRLQMSLELAQPATGAKHVVALESIEEFVDVDFFRSRIERSNALALVRDFSKTLGLLRTSGLLEPELSQC